MKLYFLPLLLTMVTGCGIFTPREITTQPLVTDQKETNDPFGFSQLLAGTVKSFSRHSWQDFFHDECEYFNLALSSTSIDRGVLISYLLQQHELYPDVVVTWERSGNEQYGPDKIVLFNVKYTVRQSNEIDSILFEGKSDFELVKDASSVWKIILWRDFTEKPFFSIGR